MSQDYILLDPSQYYDNNIATDITKYSRKEYNTSNAIETTTTKDKSVENTVKLLDVIDTCTKNVNDLQNNLNTEINFANKLKCTVVTLTILIILILIIFFCSLMYFTNCK